MDTTDLLKSLLTSATTSAIAKEASSNEKDVKSVLTEALPMLLAGKAATAAQAKTVAKTTGISDASVSKIITAALPYAKKLLKDVDTDKLIGAASKLATPENLKKAAGIASKLLNK